MATTNPITGDRMVSKVASVAFDNQFDTIFGKKERKTVVIRQCQECGAVVPCDNDKCKFEKD